MCIHAIEHYKGVFQSSLALLYDSKKGFSHLPFRISFTPEQLQKRFIEHPERHGRSCVPHRLVFGNDQQEHDDRLYAVMKRLEEAGLTLNHAKCEFRKSYVKFLSQVFTKDGVQSDPEKVPAIINMREPTCVSEVC